MELIEGVHYKRDEAIRTLLVDIEFPERVPLPYSVASFEDKAYLRNGILWLREGFRWNGASGPTKDRWFNGAQNAVRGPLAHDALYVLARRYLGPLTRQNRGQYKHWQKVADDYFRDILRIDGMPQWRRNLWWFAVRRAGFRHITATKWYSIHKWLPAFVGLW